MRKLFHGLKSIDPTLAVSAVLIFACGLMVGQQTTSEVEVVNHNRYKALTLDKCTTDYECNIAQLLDDQAKGRFVRTDDPIFFPDTMPVIEPIDCEPNDKECLKQNENAGEPAHYPSICGPYIFPNEHKERNL